MKILIISQYFWPENFKINDVALGLAERGNEITILTGKPNYPKGDFFNGYDFFNNNKEKWNKITIHRSPLIPRGNGSGLRLFLNYLSFAFFASLKVFFLKNKFEKIFVYEPSPMTVGIPAVVAKYKFKIPIIFWVQDLWPESISAAGGIKNKTLISLVNFLTKFIYDNCEKILVQSRSFIPYIIEQGVNSKKIVYHANSTEKFYKPLPVNKSILGLLPKGKKIMFAGMLGESQSFDTLLKAALILKQKNKKINWIILGDGRMKKYILDQVKKLNLQDNFILLGSFPSDDMPKFFSCADALLVSLKKSPIFSLTIPNKIQSYLACGKPIIASIDGEGGDIIRDSKSGFVSDAEDSIALAKNIELFLNLSKKELYEMSHNSLNYFRSEFEREKQLDKLLGILNE